MINEVREYFIARKAFHECPDMLKSNLNIPEASKRISSKFFSSRDRLVKAIEKNKCTGTLTDICNKWLKAHNDANECPNLVNTGKSDEAALRMKVLGEAEAEMAAFVRADYETDEDHLVKHFPNMRKET